MDSLGIILIPPRLFLRLSFFLDPEELKSNKQTNNIKTIANGAPRVSRGEDTWHEARPLLQLNLGMQVRDLERMCVTDPCMLLRRKGHRFITLFPPFPFSLLTRPTTKLSQKVNKCVLGASSGSVSSYLISSLISQSIATTAARTPLDQGGATVKKGHSVDSAKT